jgi:hypothetical protein
MTNACLPLRLEQELTRFKTITIPTTTTRDFTEPAKPSQEVTTANQHNDKKLAAKPECQV